MLKIQFHRNAAHRRISGRQNDRIEFLQEAAEVFDVNPRGEVVDVVDFMEAISVVEQKNYQAQLQVDA